MCNKLKNKCNNKKIKHLLQHYKVTSNLQLKNKTSLKLYEMARVRTGTHE